MLRGSNDAGHNGFASARVPHETHMETLTFAEGLGLEGFTA